MKYYIVKINADDKIIYRLYAIKESEKINMSIEDYCLEHFTESIKDKCEYKKCNILKIIEISEHEKDILDYVNHSFCNVVDSIKTFI